MFAKRHFRRFGTAANCGWSISKLMEAPLGPASANASVPQHTPANFSARMTDGSPGDADATNSRPTWATSSGDLRDEAILLMDRRGFHGLRRCSDG